MKRALGLAVLLLAAALAPPQAGAARIRVSQESRPGRGDFDRNVLGYIDSFAAGKMTAERFYAYAEVAAYSFNGGRPRLRADTSHLFLVEAQEGLTLFIVHDMPNDPDGGGAVLRVELVGDPSGARLLVRDDPYSDFDSYEGEPGSEAFTSWHAWFPCCTDGLVLGTLEGSWKAFVRFAKPDEGLGGDTLRGLSAWAAFSAGGSRIPLELEKGRRVLLEPIGPMVERTVPGASRPARARAMTRKEG